MSEIEDFVKIEDKSLKNNKRKKMELTWKVAKIQTKMKVAKMGKKLLKMVVRKTF